RDSSELCGELTERQVLRPLSDQPERGGVPEGVGPSVAKSHHVPVRKGEKLSQAGADPSHDRPHRRLAVRCAELRGGGQRGSLRWPHLRRTAPEPAVPWLELAGDDDAG